VFPLLRTAQYSQRPHLASTDLYRRMLTDCFSPQSKAFIEDRMHSVVYEAYRLRGKAGWNDWKLWLYAPAGDMKRSYHTDGRGVTINLTGARSSNDGGNLPR
jgi:hypothetical protein